MWVPSSCTLHLCIRLSFVFVKQPITYYIVIKCWQSIHHLVALLRGASVHQIGVLCAPRLMRAAHITTCIQCGQSIHHAVAILRSAPMHLYGVVAVPQYGHRGHAREGRNSPMKNICIPVCHDKPGPTDQRCIAH